jgi:hypothetical protein
MVGPSELFLMRSELCTLPPTGEESPDYSWTTANEKAVSVIEMISGFQ